MRRLTLRLVIAVLTFTVGAILVALWSVLDSAPLRSEDVPAPIVPAPAPVVSMHEVVATGGCATSAEAWAEINRGLFIRGAVLQSKAISKPQPLYPAAAKVARISGTVAIQIIVSDEGKVIAALPISGHPFLQQAAVKSACRVRFSPVMLSGRPIKTAGVITYNFVLQ